VHAAQKITIKDWTAEYVCNLVQNAPKTLENEHDIRRELAAQLPNVIFPIGTQNFILATANTVLPVLESEAGDDVMDNLSRFLTEGINMVCNEASAFEMSFVSHFLTKFLWQRFGSLTNAVQLYFGQDLADPSGATIKRLRPDYCLWVNGALLLKAERRSDWKELDLAKNELESKMNGWNPLALQGLPFLPCFAVAGRLIQFCALFPPARDGARPQLRDVSDVFNMATSFGRLWAMRVAFNMLRVLPVLRAKLPSSVPMLYAPHSRGLRGFIMIMDDFVAKRCKPAAEGGIYECLDPDSKSPLPCAIRVVREGQPRWNGLEDLVIRPVCRQVLPASEDELRFAIRSVVTALREFHARGFVHRDVRWPNVLRDGDCWLLSDFELAARDGAELPPDSVDPQYLPPEVNASCWRYSAAGDMFCVGRMIRFWAAGRGWSLSKGARALAARLVDTDPSKRPSAAVLTSEWSSWLNK
jgi:hypothetical protein